MHFPPITRAEVLAELRRELTTRQRVYPRWIVEGKITDEVATRRVATIQEAIVLITALDDAVQPSLFPTHAPK